MEAKLGIFDIDESDSRIIEILDSSEAFEEVNDIPIRNKLTYSNGFYVNCTALFIDIRGSSALAENHTRPVLGKLYRSYLSECVAVMNDSDECREIFINGDCVSGIFNTPYRSQIDSVFETAAKLQSTINLLNWRLEQKQYSTFSCGIGMAYGRALMLKAGNKGSGVNDVIWMGDVVNDASNLCHEGNRGARRPLQVSTIVFDNLKDEYKKLLTPLRQNSWLADVVNYEGNVINTLMDQYLTELQNG